MRICYIHGILLHNVSGTHQIHITVLGLKDNLLGLHLKNYLAYVHFIWKIKNDFPCTKSLPKCLWLPGLNQLKARGQSSLPYRWQDPRTWAINMLPLTVSKIRRAAARFQPGTHTGCGHPSNVCFLRLIFYFYLKGRAIQRGGQRKRSSICWFTL